MNEFGGYNGILYVGAWCMFAVPHQDAAWDLLEFCLSPEGMEASVEIDRVGRGKGVTQGGIPARKQAAEKWVDAMVEVSGQKRDLVEMFFRAIEHCHIFSSRGTTEFGEISDVVLKPMMDQLLMDKITVDEAIAEAVEKINEILARALE